MVNGGGTTQILIIKGCPSSLRKYVTFMAILLLLIPPPKKKINTLLSETELVDLANKILKKTADMFTFGSVLNQTCFKQVFRLKDFF